MRMTDYRTLGRSGLVVSPLCLGTMTFGAARWGTDKQQSRAVFDAFVEAGGNFIDTANVYSGGASEQMLGEFIADGKLRNKLVVATKAGFADGAGSGGNGASHLHAALDASLGRLGTDYIDMYWIHVWDSITPADELLETMAALVRGGKIRYWGLSNSPAWYVSQVATLARARGLPGPIGLQYFYSLANRDLEDEFVPLAREHGLGIVPWSPLAFGLLTGKYDRNTVEQARPRAAGLPGAAAQPGSRRPDGDKRLDGANPFGDTLFTEKNWAILDVLQEVAAATGHSPARIALAWVLRRPGVDSTLMGVSRAEQVLDNAAALEIGLAAGHQQALDAVSAGQLRMLYALFQPAMREQVVFGGRTVRSWQERQDKR